MPNWSSNALILTPLNDNGNKAIADYIEEIKSTTRESFGGLFSKRFPRPASVENGDGRGACNWSHENWGTKWDIWVGGWSPIEFVDESEEHLHLTFDTAWAPPTEYVRRLSEQLPDVRFELAYSEQGMAFAGVQVIVNGNIESVTDVEVTWDKTWDDCYEEGGDDKDASEPEPSGEWAAHMEKYRIDRGG